MKPWHWIVLIIITCIFPEVMIPLLFIVIVFVNRKHIDKFCNDVVAESKK